MLQETQRCHCEDETFATRRTGKRKKSEGKNALREIEPKNVARHIRIFVQAFEWKDEWKERWMDRQKIDRIRIGWTNKLGNCVHQSRK